MEESFETRPILAIEKLRALQERDDLSSLLRLTTHLFLFVALIALIVRFHNAPLFALLLSLALSWVWCGLFAPFHECTHQTAFKTKKLNDIGVWLSGVPFAMAPAVYKTFHFEHHRYTQDVHKDPELLNDRRYLQWPTGLNNWFVMATGLGLMNLKFAPLFGFAFKSRERWQEFAKWVDRAPAPERLVFECRIIIGLWLVFLLSSLFWIPGGGWLIFAAWFTHVFQTLWVASEHTGLPEDGNILRRTRSVTTNRFVRFWLWNMNFHAEHHAWPSIPWHQLPDAHHEIADQLESWVPSYSALHLNIINARNTPSCDP